MTVRGSGQQVLLQQFAADTRQRLVRHVNEICTDKSVIHAGFCAHTNPGDNAISVAETHILNAAGKRAAGRISDISMMEHPGSALDRIRVTPGPLPIVVSGGGFLTHLYPEILTACTLLIREFADRPILIMPQSSNLDESPVSNEFVAAVRSHPRIRLLARDDATLGELSDRTTADVQLAPDSVLTSGPVTRNRRHRRVPVALVARQDGEEAPDRGALPRHPILPWMNEPRAFHDPRLLPARLQDRALIPGWGSDLLMRTAAVGRTRRGISMVRSAKLILADRLHAVILSLVTQTPVVAVDNCYGKVHGAINTWGLAELGPVGMASTFQEAEEVGAMLFGSQSTRGST